MPIRLTKLKFLFLPLLAAAVVSALLWLLFLRQQLPYNLDLVYRAMNPADEIGPMRLYYYHDFENDGISEFVGLGSDALRTDENKTNSVQIFSSDKRPIDQFLVKGTIANLEYPFFADINQDGVDEVIVATVANDSIFFSIIDRKNLSYLLRDQFVLERTYFRPDHEWGLTVAFSDAIDFDNDGEIEIICNISAGWGLQPRMMAVYDVPEKRIIKYRDLPYTQPYYTFYDLNQDGEPEYILNGGYAMANMLEKNGQHDWTAWLHYLDKDLNPLRPPLQGGSEYSAFRALPILYENEPALFVIHFINSPMQTWLRIYNSNFQEICQRVFPNARIWSSKARVGVKHNSSILKEPVKTPIVLTQQSGNNYELIKVDLNLDVIDRVSFASGKKIMGDNIFANFPSEKVNSFILQTTHELFIYDDNMQIIAKWERPEDLNKPLAGLSLRARADGSYRIVASAPELIELDVLPNRIFAWRYFLLAGAFFGLFCAVFFANRMVANSRENHQIGQMMLGHTRIGVAKITQSGEIGSFNPALLRLLEIAEPTKNDRIETVFANYPDLQQSIDNAMKSNEPLEQKIVEKPQLSVRLSPIESTGN
ncbi:MAG: hypothetical protein KDH95_23345, partial [Calditrichaeota bacterium]|nr:hypothetical protein [Calditrichota bacterium]